MQAHTHKHCSGLAVTTANRHFWSPPLSALLHHLLGLPHHGCDDELALTEPTSGHHANYTPLITAAQYMHVVPAATVCCLRVSIAQMMADRAASPVI